MAKEVPYIEIPFTPLPNQFEALVASYRPIDGDSVDVRLDLGFNIKYEIEIRVRGVDTPETHGKHTEQFAAGAISFAAAKHWLAKIPPGRLMVRTTKEPDKYGGRWLGEFFDLLHPKSTLTDYLLTAKYARPYAGEAKPPWTAPELAAIIKLGPPK